jgi:hypothetical protein
MEIERHELEVVVKIRHAILEIATFWRKVLKF